MLKIKQAVLFAHQIYCKHQETIKKALGKVIKIASRLSESFKILTKYFSNVFARKYFLAWTQILEKISMLKWDRGTNQSLNARQMNSSYCEEKPVPVRKPRNAKADFFKNK